MKVLDFILESNLNYGYEKEETNIHYTIASNRLAAQYRIIKEVEKKE